MVYILHIYICTRVHISIVCVCVCVSACACTCVRISIVCVCMCVCVCTYMYRVCVSVCVCVCVCECMCECVSACAYVHREVITTNITMLEILGDINYFSPASQSESHVTVRIARHDHLVERLTAKFPQSVISLKNGVVDNFRILVALRKAVL